MFKGGVLGAALICGVSACTDDHFDIRPGEATGANTLWQNIAAEADLDSVAMILSKAKVMNKERDKTLSMSYAELLSQSQEYTAWLPKNGSFNAKQYLDILDNAQAALDANNRDDAMTLYYEVANKFVRNHIARFNYEDVTESSSVRLLNSKLATYVPGVSFNGTNLDAGHDKVVSSNGVLHVLDGQSAFSNNIYDYWSDDSRLFDFFTAIDSFTRYEFNSYASTPGGMNENGQMEYIDSAMTKSNLRLSYANLTNIDNEDSLYIAILPQNEAYAKAYEEVAKLYNYKDSYNYDWTADNGSKATFPTTFSFSALKADSLKIFTENAINQAILSHAFVSTSMLPIVNKRDSAEIFNYIYTADSLTTPVYNTLYNKNVYSEDGDPAAKNPIFGGVEPVKASNGYIFNVDEWGFDPAYTYLKRIEVTPSDYNVATARSVNTVTYGEQITLNYTIMNPEVDLNGLVTDSTYYKFTSPGSGRSSFDVRIKLPGVLSGNYKISVVLLPTRTNLNYLNSDAENEGRGRVQFSIVDDSNSGRGSFTNQDGNIITNEVDGTTTVLKYIDQTKAEKVVLWENFKFPYCYASLPGNIDSFVSLNMQLSYANAIRSGLRTLNIVKVILEPVRGGE